VAARGTLRFGPRDSQPYHMFLDQHQQLALRKGPDPRDWAALDRGALDYSKIAQQEHFANLDDFAGHVGGSDGAIARACMICAEAGNPIEAAAKALVEAKRAGQALGNGAVEKPSHQLGALNGPVPDVLTPEQETWVAARQAEADAAEAAAKVERDTKAAMVDKVSPEVAALQAELATMRAQLEAQVLETHVPDYEAPPGPKAAARKPTS
jgi:hypothetical protein